MAHTQRPRAREHGLVTEAIGDELVVYDTDRHVAHSLNPTATRVWRACDGRHDLDALAAACELDRPTLTLALDRLNDVELLDGAPGPAAALPPASTSTEDGVSRRSMLRRGVLAGATLGVALPVIRSITAPSIAMAFSGRSGNQVKGRAGYACTTDAQCSPGSFCNSSAGVSSCQRDQLTSCANNSSCTHNGSLLVTCNDRENPGSYVCNGNCTADGECPNSYPVCSGGRCHKS